MNAPDSTAPEPTAPGTAHQLRHQIPLLVWLVLVWNLLWGTWSWANLLSGLLIALLVTILLPLPPVVGGAHAHPRGLVVFVGQFLFDLVRSAGLVAWQTIRPQGIGHSAIIEVQMRTDSDLLLTIVAEAVTLVPGSLVIDMDREHRTLAIHVLHVKDEAEVERRRQSVLAEEERVVRAFGSPDEVAALFDPQQSGSGRRTP